MNSHKFIYSSTICTLHLEKEVQATLDVGAFRMLFVIMEPAFRPLTLEVLCTIQCKEDIQRELPSAIHFQAENREFHITIAEFTLALGVHTVEEMEALEFRDIPFFDANIDTTACWAEISTGSCPLYIEQLEGLPATIEGHTVPL